MLAFAVALACPFKSLVGQDELPADHPLVPGIGARRRRLSEDTEVEPTRLADPSPDSGTTTNMGCECESSCAATVDFGSATCDWCKTKDKCGHYSYSHLTYYDYCVYPDQSSYEERSASVKFQELWTQVTADTDHGDYPNPVGAVGESIQTTFDDQWDVMPAGRLKYIHSVGIHCHIDFKIDSDKYTGVFDQGSHDAIFRLGSATDVSEKSGGSVPGIGIKLLRTNVKSANWVMLHSLDGGPSYDMFGYTQSNHIPPPTGATQILAQKFLQASNCVTMVGLSDAAMWDQDGVQSASPKFPYELQLKPTGNAKISENAAALDDILQSMLEQTPADVVLYDIYAKENPGSDLVKIGSVTTKAQCVTSKFGDEKLFFRHQRMEEDFTIRSDWTSEVDPKDCWASDKVPTTPPAKCSTYSGHFE